MHKLRSSLGLAAVRGSNARWRAVDSAAAAATAATGRAGRQQRTFRTSRPVAAVKPFILADIGEGIKEVQIIQWFVQPGARVEQFDKICEVQSDKASVDITSRFDGVIKKLHYEADAMAQVGKPLLDIDITGDIAPQDEKLLQPEGGEQAAAAAAGGEQARPIAETMQSGESNEMDTSSAATPPPSGPHGGMGRSGNSSSSAGTSSASHSALATPAVRGLLKEKGLEIHEIQGTGRDGRVTKEDVHSHLAGRKNQSSFSSSVPTAPHPRDRPSSRAQQETRTNLSGIQTAMFRSMTQSLSIPHFLCADEVDLTELTTLRQQLNASANASATRLSALPFIVKAVSLSLESFPLLNARLDTSAQPAIIYRAMHNIGIAIDTPSGLMVPNIKDVGARSIADIAAELRRLQAAGQANRLGPADLQGGTISISNIGSIAGSYATPLLVDGQVAILAVGRSKRVPVFDDRGSVVARDIAAFSWSADHRVVDGATVARMALAVKLYLETPGRMMLGLR